MPGSKRRYILTGLILIVVIYTLYYMAFVYVGNFNQIPRRVRHIARLLSILMVYGVGYYSFKKYGVKWIFGLWNIIYFVVIILLILIGIYDWGFGPASMQVRNIAKTLHEFLISPVLFIGIWIINRTLTKNTAA